MLRQVIARPGSHLLLLVSATLVLYFGFAIVGRTVQLYELRQNEGRLERELAALETQRQDLLQRKALVSADAYVERVAREQMGLVKPGEIGVLVLTPDKPQAFTQPVPEVDPDSRTNWERWLDWLLPR